MITVVNNLMAWSSAHPLEADILILAIWLFFVCMICWGLAEEE